MSAQLYPDVCFVTSPNSWSSAQLPYYYLYLASWLEKNGLRCEIIDEKRDKYYYRFFLLGRTLEDWLIKKIISRILAIKPRYIGFAVFITDYPVIMRLAAEIKKVYNVPIIVGNAQATIMPEDFIFPGSPIDYAVIGEGEVTLCELVRALDSKADAGQVTGLAYLQNGLYKQTARRKLIEDLGVLPLPDYRKVNMEYYLRPGHCLIRFLPLSVVGIYTGRGCPYQCEFCASNAVWKQHGEGRAVRLRPVDDVINELILLKNRYAIDGFHIVDDTFNVSKKRVVEFCDKLMDAKLDLIWGAQVRANLFDEELLKIVKRANCVQFEFGIESGSQRLLNLIKKGITVEQVKYAFNTCSKYGMRTFANILVNLPTETEQDVKETEQLMEDIKATVYGFGITTPYPGTALFNRYFTGKIRKEDYPLFSDVRTDREFFRMSQHKLNCETLLEGWDKKFRYKVCSELFTNKDYRKRVLRSRRIGGYLSAFAVKGFKSRINMRKMYKNYYSFYSKIARSVKFLRRPHMKPCD